MKLYFSANEVCEELGIPKTTLEYYLMEFKIPIKKAGRDRKFQRKDIDKLKFIVQLIRDDGFTLEGAKAQIKLKTKTESENREVIERLEDIRNFLQILKNAISI